MSTRNVSLMEAARISPEFFSFVTDDGVESEVIHADGWTILPVVDHIAIHVLCACGEHIESVVVLSGEEVRRLRVEIVDEFELADELIAEAEAILRSAAE